MATLKLTVFKAKVLKDGRHKIRIAVCHKHETSYIITNFIIDSESQFKNGQVVKRPDASMMNSKLRNFLNEYQEKLDAIKNKEIYSCIQIKNIISKSQSENESATFQQICMAYENELVEKGSSGYAGLLRQNRKYFTEYVHGDILLCDITPEIIEGYSAFLRKNKKLGETTNGMMMRHTKTIINRGIKKRMVKYEVHPYIDFSIPSSPVRDIDISVETFNAIRKSSPQEKRLRIARDVFCLSFYLGGINLIDLMSYDFKKSERIEYVRTKSRNTTVGVKVISFTIPEPAMAIIRTWMNKTTGKLDFGYKFTYKNFQRYISRSLAALVKSIGISEKVMFYSARKSFAQYASEIGIPDGIIDYCLGHSDKSKGVIRYYTKVRQKQADMAISRVIDYVDNPEKYKQYIELRSDIMMMRG
ncbi:site-specific integrase [Phocaeicola plebeius]|uniref:site-specific integrase n=1 Tax=Phocaeicola plebeius TaxID=310297 RepID=UPI0026EF44C2|nr:site-specific integrase [Phocaeicola plebeius]